MILMPIFAAVEGNPFKQIADQFGWEKRLFFSQCALFIMVAFVLAKFAYKPLLAMLELRKQQIEESIKNAERTRAELDNAKKTAQEIIGTANTQANKLIEEARAAAARVQELETQKAIAGAEQITLKAKEATEQERLRMMSELRREVGRLVIDTTTKVTGKVLTPDDQKRLADDTTRQLSA